MMSKRNGERSAAEKTVEREHPCEVQTDDGAAKCVILSIEWNERLNTAHANRLLQSLFDGIHCPFMHQANVYDVTDDNVFIFSSIPLEYDEAQNACRQYLLAMGCRLRF